MIEEKEMYLNKVYDKDVTNREKLGIIASHICNIKNNKFNLELMILDKPSRLSKNDERG